LLSPIDEDALVLRFCLPSNGDPFKLGLEKRVERVGEYVHAIKGLALSSLCYFW
jgi:hypothetical protein